MTFHQPGCVCRHCEDLWDEIEAHGMTQTQHSLTDYASAVRAGDVADFCDRLIDMQLERLAWLDRPISQVSTRDGGGNASCGNPPPTDR